MSTYPTAPRSAFLEWCRAHDAIFTDHAAEIGLSPAQAAEFSADAATLAAKMLAQRQAEQAARVATQEVVDAFGRLRANAGDAVRTIRAFAANQGDPHTIYSLAQIPPPAERSPLPPPAQPKNLSVSLGASDGRLTLSWKASNPAGTSGTAYIIRRKLPGEPGFSCVGITGKKTFVDETVVLAGAVREGILAPGMLAPAVQYTVQGQRADQSGPVSEVFTVNFGKLPGGKATPANVTARTADARTWNVELPAPGGSGQFAAERGVRTSWRG